LHNCCSYFFYNFSKIQTFMTQIAHSPY
jgi:hypothetical protein